MVGIRNRTVHRNYLILTINKRLFTMKVENHDTTKTRKPTRKSFKKGNTKNVNKYQTLFNNVRTRVL